MLLVPAALVSVPVAVGSTTGLLHQTEDVLITVLAPATITWFALKRTGVAVQSIKSASALPSFSRVEIARTVLPLRTHVQSNRPSASVIETPAQVVRPGAEKTRSSPAWRHGRSTVPAALMKLHAVPVAVSAVEPSLATQSIHREPFAG